MMSGAILFSWRMRMASGCGMSDNEGVDSFTMFNAVVMF